MYWAAACGGCEISLLEIHDKILDLVDSFDIVFWPCMMDAKKKDVEKVADGEIDLTFFNGAIRNQENEEMARVLRKKSKSLVAYGSCAIEGCIPGLSNLTSRADHFQAIYLNNHSTANSNGTVPEPVTEVPEGTLTLPAFHERVRTLDQTVRVDYFLPGCPPEARQVQSALHALMPGRELPPAGSYLGAGDKALCEECPRQRNVQRINRFYRAYEIIPVADICLLEQGLLCMGPATRSGCGALCPQNNMACVGCYGPPPGVADQGAQMIGAIGSLIRLDYASKNEKELIRDIESILSSIADPVGTFYKFSLAKSLVGGKRLR
jgi:F420-non-reducing hydrogenase small subunit